MSYSPTTDLLALLRLTSGGTRSGRTPGLDYIVAALARMGLFTLYVGYVAPTTNQANTVWLMPAPQSWAAEGTVFLWNHDTSEYELATPTLWSVLIISATSAPIQVQQEITAPGPANIIINAGTVKVNQTISAAITLIMPLSASKVGGVLVSDWKGNAGQGNAITVQLSGSDVFPGGLTSWQIASDAGSLYFRPVTGGYMI